MIDATPHMERPSRGRGPFPGSVRSGHSPGLPIRLEFQIPTRELRPDGTTLIDFIITNIGTEPIKLPTSVAFVNSERREDLTLWVTSDGIKDQYLRTESGRTVKIEFVWISAELEGFSDDPKTISVLAPNKSIRVHAFSPQLKPGSHSFTAHAELLRISNGSSERVGTADSETVRTTFSTARPTLR